MISRGWYSLDFNSISDWRITSPRCYPVDKWSSTEFRKWKRWGKNVHLVSRTMEEEWKWYNATFFFFRVPETIVDIFLVFEFQLSLSLFSCRGCCDPRGERLEPTTNFQREFGLTGVQTSYGKFDGRQKQSDVRENCIRRGIRGIIVPTVFLHAVRC